MSLPTTPPTTPAHHQGSSFTTLRPVRFPPPKRKRSSVAVVEIPETPWKAKEPSSGGEQLAGELRDLQLEPAGKKRRGERLRSPPPLEVDEDEDEEEELSSDPDQFGVAHVPTSMQRYARSQKRLQQIKEYKVRESREAREKRTAERRRKRSQSRSEAANAAGRAEETARKKVVHFRLETGGEA